MKPVIYYSVAMTVIDVVAFVVLNAILPTYQDAQARELSTTFVYTMGLMFCAGALGGCLYNFRGLTKHSQLGDYREEYNLSYYLRPLSAGISGLMVFFLLLGGALTLNVGNQFQPDHPAWQSLIGRMPYVALSLLAGYGSQEFMMKLKDLAETLFALRNKDSGQK
ncbi:MAG: hypothetical protein ACM3TN_14250 [Alphaproteobacteria bacterium]